MYSLASIWINEMQKWTLLKSIHGILSQDYKSILIKLFRIL